MHTSSAAVGMPAGAHLVPSSQPPLTAAAHVLVQTGPAALGELPPRSAPSPMPPSTTTSAARARVRRGVRRGGAGVGSSGVTGSPVEQLAEGVEAFRRVGYQPFALASEGGQVGGLHV